jgi:hypothetical protein
MKEFYKKNKYLVQIILLLTISLFPTIFTLFYKKRLFVDLGLLITSILLIILTIPIYTLIKKGNKDK